MREAGDDAAAEDRRGEPAVDGVLRAADLDEVAADDGATEAGGVAQALGHVEVIHRGRGGRRRLSKITTVEGEVESERGQALVEGVAELTDDCVVDRGARRHVDRVTGATLDREVEIGGQHSGRRGREDHTDALKLGHGGGDQWGDDGCPPASFQEAAGPPPRTPVRGRAKQPASRMHRGSQSQGYLQLSKADARLVIRCCKAPEGSLGLPGPCPAGIQLRSGGGPTRIHAPPREPPSPQNPRRGRGLESQRESVTRSQTTPRPSIPPVNSWRPSGEKTAHKVPRLWPGT